MNDFIFRTGVALLTILSGWGCQSEGSDPRVQVGCYHWQGTFDLKESEKNWLNTLGIERLYLRLFDLDAAERQAPYPVGSLANPESVREVGEIVPTVFITNRSFQGLSPGAIEVLAEKCWAKIHRISGQWPDSVRIPEWQFDCDWTGSTRDAYFSFLRILGDSLHRHQQQISATIRLHQVKFADRTGIPPVDRGMLMPYNVGDVTDPNTVNSILNLDILEQYLVGFDRYSLPLDVALPLFHWGVIFREGKLVRLINQLDASDLRDTTRFRPLTEGVFSVRKSTYLNGYYLYEGDQIRLEAVTPNQLTQLARKLHQNLVPSDRHIVFYHLDSELITRFSYEQLAAVLSQFR